MLEDYKEGFTIEDVDGQYLDSYSSLEVHKMMLDDTERMQFYRRVLSSVPNPNSASNPNDHGEDPSMPPCSSSVQGEVVVDVGSGTGVLSMWAAQYGMARHVFAVEGCAKVAALSSQLILDNGLEKSITVVSTTVEDLVGRGVDDFILRYQGILSVGEGIQCRTIGVVLSEWMGFYLFHEGMLASVLRARDFFSEVNRRIFLEGQRKKLEVCGQEDERGDGAQKKEKWSYEDFVPLMIPAVGRIHCAPITLAPLFQRYASSPAPLLAHSQHEISKLLGRKGEEKEKEKASVKEEKASVETATCKKLWGLKLERFVQQWLEEKINANEGLLVESLTEECIYPGWSSEKYHQHNTACWFDFRVVKLSEVQHLKFSFHFSFEQRSIDKEEEEGQRKRNAKNQEAVEIVNENSALDGFAVWFDVHHVDQRCMRQVVLGRGGDLYSLNGSTKNFECPVGAAHCLRTGPCDAPTHWKQCVLLLPAECRREADPIITAKKIRASEDPVLRVALSMDVDEHNPRVYHLSFELE